MDCCVLINYCMYVWFQREKGKNRCLVIAFDGVQVAELSWRTKTTLVLDACSS